MAYQFNKQLQRLFIAPGGAHDVFVYGESDGRPVKFPYIPSGALSGSDLAKQDIATFTVAEVMTAAATTGVRALSLRSAGEDYVAGDVLTLALGTGGTVAVTAVNAGAIVGWYLKTAGDNYEVGERATTGSATGVGATFAIEEVGGGPLLCVAAAGENKFLSPLCITAVTPGNTGLTTGNMMVYWGSAAGLSTQANGFFASLFTTSWLAFDGVSAMISGLNNEDPAALINQPLVFVMPTVTSNGTLALDVPVLRVITIYTVQDVAF